MNLLNKSFVVKVIMLFLLTCKLSAADEVKVKIYPDIKQQTIKGWGGNIYPFETDDKFLDYIFDNLPSQYVRVFNRFPAAPDNVEISLLKYLNNKKIKTIINIKLSDDILKIADLPDKVLDYVKYLNAKGVTVDYISLNEPDARINKGLNFKNYINMVRKINEGILLHKLKTKFIGPDTTTPNNWFMQKLANDNMLEEFDVLTYHTYEYGVNRDLKKIASIAQQAKKSVWLTEQNYKPNLKGVNIYSKEYALNNMRNLFLGINDGYAEVSLFFCYAWGQSGGIVLFDKERRIKPLFYELSKLYKNAPVGSDVLRTEADLPSLAIKTKAGILLFVINDQSIGKQVQINVGAKSMSKNIKPMSMDIITIAD